VKSDEKQNDVIYVGNHSGEQPIFGLSPSPGGPGGTTRGDNAHKI
jgi:hypothetical protein